MRVLTIDLVRQKVSCDLCGIPIFLYPGEYPGTCSDCETKLRDRDEMEDRPCPECGRIWSYQRGCDYCWNTCCEACRHNEHLDFCYSDWDDE